MTGLETISGWLFNHTFTLVYGAVVAIVLTSFILWTGIAGFIRPFLDDLRCVSEIFRDIVANETALEFQMFLGLVAIAFSIFGGLVIFAVLSLVGHLATPSG